MTEPQPASRTSYSFAGFQLDARTAELRRDGELLPLRPLAARALVLLVERHGALVTRGELRSHLWGERHLDASGSLNQCIRQLRAALGDDARSPRILATVHRRGYRIIVPVEVASLGEVGGLRHARRPRGRERWRYVLAGLGTAALAAASLVAVCAALALT